MGIMPTLERYEPPAVDAEMEAPAIGGRAIAALGTRMTILGAVRLAGDVADYSLQSWPAWATGEIGSRGLGWFLATHSPAYVLIGGWPLVVGLALRRSRRRDLLWAGALTFLVLSIGGMTVAMADWGLGPRHRVTIGSFRMSTTAWGHLTGAELAAGVAGATQLLLELATAAVALWMAKRLAPEAPATSPREEWRRGRFDRLAIYVSIAFLLLTIRLPAWSAYVGLLSHSQWLREFILREDIRRTQSVRTRSGPEPGWTAQARSLSDDAQTAWNLGKYAEASERYSQLADLLDSVQLHNGAMNAAERRMVAEAFNNYAWLLATCPETSLRDDENAVRFARRAVELEPGDHAYWNTLGVAQYRLGAMDDALSALYRSMELHDEGDSSDWYFLAMIHRRLGHDERAREWYEMAVQHARMYDAGNEELYRFQVEAAEALGLPRPEEPAAVSGRRGPPRPGPMPYPPHRGRSGSRGGRERRLEIEGRSVPQKPVF